MGTGSVDAEGDDGMGLFDWFKGKNAWEVADEPELRPERQLAAPKPEPGPKVAATAAASAAAASKSPQTKPAPAPRPAVEDDMPDFGIQKAIELMRDLPSKDSEAVVQAMCKTLASIGVEVPDIIKQAKDKQSSITGRIKDLRKEIADLEEEIAGRKEEISALEADHSETGEVRLRLERATKPGVDPKPAAGAVGAAPKAAADKSAADKTAPKPAVAKPGMPKPAIGSSVGPS